MYHFLSESLNIIELLNTPNDNIKGGLSKGMTILDIAKKHNVSPRHIIEQCKMGIKVEHEHTDDDMLALEIAMDHLVEDKDYYTKLEKMESDRN